MTDKLLTKTQVETIKADLEAKLTAGLQAKGHKVERLNNVDDVYVLVDIRAWGEPSYRTYHPAGWSADDNYAKAVQVSVNAGRYSKTTRRTKKDGTMSLEDIQTLVDAISDVANQSKQQKKAEQDAKDAKANTVQQLKELGFHLEYSTVWFGRPYSSQQGKAEVNSDGSLKVELTIHAADVVKILKFAEFMAKFNDATEQEEDAA